jgi:hypothetical protein
VVGDWKDANKLLETRLKDWKLDLDYDVAAKSEKIS